MAVKSTNIDTHCNHCQNHDVEIKMLKEKHERLDNHKQRILKELENTSDILTNLKGNVHELKIAVKGSDLNTNDNGIVGDIRDLTLKVAKLEEKTILFSIFEKLGWLIVGILIKYILDGKVDILPHQREESTNPIELSR